MTHQILEIFTLQKAGSQTKDLFLHKLFSSLSQKEPLLASTHNKNNLPFAQSLQFLRWNGLAGLLGSLLGCPCRLLLTLYTLDLQLGRHSALWSRGKSFWEEPTDLGSQFFSSRDRQFQVHKWGLSVTNESMLLEINVIESNDRGDVLFTWGGSLFSLPDSGLSAKTGKPAHQPLEFLERSI